MRKLFVCYFYVSILILGILTISGFRNFSHNSFANEKRTVYIKKTNDDFQLIRNGKPFYIQGGGGNSNLKELSEIGGNTLRVYDTINLENILNEAFINNIAIIVDIPLPESDEKYRLYSNEETNEIMKEKIRKLVNRFKNHPSLLMWNLGNEIDFQFIFGRNDFVKTFKDFVDIIRFQDPNHPVSTTIAGVSRKSMISIYSRVPKLDLVSFNTFGDTKNFNKKLNQISFLFGRRPYYFSEIGSDGMWESKITSWHSQIEQTSVKKAEQLITRLNYIEKHRTAGCLGYLVFYWGNKHELTFTWFSLFYKNRKSEIIKHLESYWKKSDLKKTKIGLEYMLLDNKGSYDNIIFNPGEIKQAEIKFTGGENDSVEIKWEIYPEKWHHFKGNQILDGKKPMDLILNSEKRSTTFKTPLIEGPYRIFAYIYDKDGFFATTNTPFYVLNNK